LPALQLFFLFGFFRPIALGALKAIIRLTVHKSLLSFAIVSKSMTFAVAPSAHHLAVLRKFGAFVPPPSVGGIRVSLSKPHFLDAIYAAFFSSVGGLERFDSVVTPSG
jgi:hypothetical protein